MVYVGVVVVIVVAVASDKPMVVAAVFVKFIAVVVVLVALFVKASGVRNSMDPLPSEGGGCGTAAADCVEDGLLFDIICSVCWYYNI